MSANAKLANTQPASGLYIIQFTTRPDPVWREELQQRKVELLRYVPVDAFVARLDRARIDEIAALPYVQWIGRYRPDHKILDSLRPGPTRKAIDRPEVSVLMSPAATSADMDNTRGRFGRLDQESRLRFGAVLRGELAPGQLQKLAESEAVLWIEPAPKMQLFDESSAKIVGGDGANRSTYVLDSGFNGTGIRVAVADSGLHSGTVAGMHPDLTGRVVFLPTYPGIPDASDGHGHGTHVAGIIAGTGAAGSVDGLGRWYGLGMATGATIVVQRLFDNVGRYVPPPSFAQLTRDAVQAGAIIGNNSWGSDAQGRYDVSAHEFDSLVRDADLSTPGDQPYIIAFSAGNAGPASQTIASPAVAKNVITTGAAQGPRTEFFTYSDGVNVVADFSSRGPCEDGRIKPDVVAPGTWIASARSALGNPQNALQVIDQHYQYMAGTSQAGPHVSGAAAVFVQYYRQINPDAGSPSPALVKAALIHSASDLNSSGSGGSAPNAVEGWGRVDLSQIIRTYPRTQEYLDQTVRLTNGQIYERRLVVADANSPLKITLAYTDVPGLPAAIPALVNDLDLELVAPDGRRYRGNQFEGGESVPNAPSGDSLNNVEGILLRSPLPGEYFVRIIARNVVEDAVVGTTNFDQDFALVVSGDIPGLETGVVVLDRGSYRAPGQIRIKLFDLDLKDDPTATVTARSSIEPAGQLVVLTNIAPGGVFMGSISTAAGTVPNPDGKLQISHGSSISVEYYDAGENELRVAGATGDMLAPEISNVSITNQFGRAIVSWVTDEESDSVVRLGTGVAGTNLLFSTVTSNGVRSTMHRLELTSLAANTTYYFSVSSTDAAGNTATSTNGGGFYQFVSVPSAAVLLVDAYIPDPNDTYIPPTTYTDALDQTGVSYDVWNGAAQLPLFSDLQSYQIVIWRINDSYNRSDDYIPGPQQAAIRQYLNAGGAFFMASMEILSRMRVHGGSDFVTNVLHVQRFLPNTDPFSTCTNCDEDFRVATATGVDGDLIGDGFLSSLNYSNYPVFIEELGLGPDFGDTFGPSTNAAAFLFESVSGKACAMHFPQAGHESVGRVVFASFPFDAIPENGPAPNNRPAFLRRVLQFLSPGINGVGFITFDQSTYRLPDLVSIEIADSDLAGSGSVMVPVSSTSDTTPVYVAARETARPGLFRAVVSLVTTGTTNRPAQISAGHGEFLYTSYFDGSGQSVVQARARVDASRPTISIPVVKAGWYDARVSWTTSEPSDALVQFGESAFLGRTSYSPGMATNQAVRLAGLIPDRMYSYRVVSRDVAGNDSSLPNTDSLYNFRTLPPLPQPFVESVESILTETNWSVATDPASQFSWETGSPNNNIVSSGHNSSRAWATKLLVDTADTIDTKLIGPAVNLTGGNVATLQFWHAYDFRKVVGVDTQHWGRLFIITNGATAPVLLREYTGTTTNWVFEEIDLSPFLGRVVSFMWHHKLASIGRQERRSWALDDISITVSNLALGSIAISNNLSQAQFTISGRTSRSGAGSSVLFTNLIPGGYSVTWTDVPFYFTPPQQTNSLPGNGLLSFSGSYTFPDENGNGMSDLWELANFGEVSPERTLLTDTDSDGATDYEEFIAGTDPKKFSANLRLKPPVHLAAQDKLRLDWNSATGRTYRIEGLTVNFSAWVPLSPWIYASGTNASATIPAPNPVEPDPYIFRIEVRP